MNFEIVYTHNFERELKLIAKKHLSIKKDLGKLIDELEVNPKLGTPIGHDCYKIRMAISSKGKGKSGGARIITHVYIKGKLVYLLSVYDKSEHESVSDKRIIELINKLGK
jgi:mRNA-degrading endonuclease RelE of RelBE toxin-antitoxin system